MSERVSLYRELEEPVLVFHNKNILPHVNVPHLHSQYEFYYNIDGAMGLFAEKKFYECTGNDLFLLPRLSVHKVIVDKSVNYERCIINIDAKVIDAVNAAPGMHEPLSWIGDVDDLMPRKVNLNQEEHQRFVEMIDDYNNPPQNELMRYAKFLRLLAFLGEIFAGGRDCTIRSREPETILEKALLMVEEHFKELKISEISEKLYVNSSHLSVLFKEEYGITLERYLIIRKIAEAKKFLYMGVPVKEVCQLCGFHNFSNFIRTFKKYEGYSPKNLERLSSPL